MTKNSGSYSQKYSICFLLFETCSPYKANVLLAGETHSPLTRVVHLTMVVTLLTLANALHFHLWDAIQCRSLD